MATTYIGIFSDGTSIEDNSLSRVAGIDDVKYLLSKETEGHTSPTTYTIIDDDGNNYHLTNGNFSVLHIGPSGVFSDAHRRKITIKDNRLNQIHTYQATSSGVQFFYEQLLPLLEKLNKIGSWEMYEKLIELDEAYKEIEKLKSKIKTLEDKLTAQ
jgi:hypothetical protein